MNANLKTALLTVLTLSVFTIALIELSGVSRKALFNKLDIKENHVNAAAVAAAAPTSTATAAPAVVNDHPKTVVKFDKDTFDFGTIKDGDIVKHTYKFKNTGTHPLIIDDVIATCGCTIPSYTKTPIPPGQTGEIKISFNSKGKAGNVSKSITVISNAEEERIPLHFKATVK